MTPEKVPLHGEPFLRQDKPVQGEPVHGEPFLRQDKPVQGEPVPDDKRGLKILIPFTVNPFRMNPLWNEYPLKDIKHWAKKAYRKARLQVNWKKAKKIKRLFHNLMIAFQTNWMPDFSLGILRLKPNIQSILATREGYETGSKPSRT